VKRPHQDFKIGFLSDGATRMSCENAQCANFQNGFVVVLDPQDAKHANAATLIKQDQTRKHVALRSQDALDYLANHAERMGLTDHPEALTGVIERTPPDFLVFIFAPGTQCFAPHKDREVLFVHRTSRNVRVHTRPVDFNEDMDESADRVGRLRQRG
jgi:hypothetical protein